MGKTAFEFKEAIRSMEKRGERYDPYRSITPAIIKEVDGAVSPASQPAKVWISEYGSDNSRVLAWNPSGIQVAETPVLVGRSPRPPFERVVLGINLAAMFQSPSNTQITLIDTGPHGQNHQIPSEDNPGLDPVYTFIYALMPLKTTSAGTGLTVSVQPYTYRLGPSIFAFPGQDVDLTSYLPAVGNIKIVLLYLDEGTNSIAVAEGAEVVDNGVIEVPYPDVPDEGRPSSFIALTGGQTVILQTSVEEARDLFPRGTTGSSGDGDSEHVITDTAPDTDLAAISIRRRTGGTPPDPGLGVRVDFTIDNRFEPDQHAGDHGVAWVDAANPDQNAGYFVHLNWGANRIPMFAMTVPNVSPVDIRDVLSAMGTGSVHLGVIADVTKLAGGGGSFIIGGVGDNATDADRAGVLAGENNLSIGTDSISMGSGAVAAFDQAFAQAGGIFADQGDCNNNRVPIKGMTEDNTPVDLRVLPIPLNTHFGFTLTMVARRVTGAVQGAFYRRRGSGYTGAVAGGISLTSVVTEGTDVEDDVAWDLTVTADGSDDSIRVVGTGAAADTVYWGGILELHWVSG